MKKQRVKQHNHILNQLAEKYFNKILIKMKNRIKKIILTLVNLKRRKIQFLIILNTNKGKNLSLALLIIIIIKDDI